MVLTPIRSPLLLLLPFVAVVCGRTECMQVIGTLKCPAHPELAAGIRMDLKDADYLPFEIDDQMGRTWSYRDGTFILSGCGSDFGPFNAPDPYITFEHTCPSIYPDLKPYKKRTMQFALTKTFLPKILRIGKVFLDDSDA